MICVNPFLLSKATGLVLIDETARNYYLLFLSKFLFIHWVSCRILIAGYLNGGEVIQATIYGNPYQLVLWLRCQFSLHGSSVVLKLMILCKFILKWKHWQSISPCPVWLKCPKAYVSMFFTDIITCFVLQSPAAAPMRTTRSKVRLNKPAPPSLPVSTSPAAADSPVPPPRRTRSKMRQQQQKPQELPAPDTDEEEMEVEEEEQCTARSTR